MEDKIMILEISLIKKDEEWEVQIWDVENQERVEDLERVFDDEKEASDYIDSLAKNKKYVIYHV
jgi:hypothetical protein